MKLVIVMDYKLVHNEDRSRMQAVAKGKTIGLIDYKMAPPKVMTIYHTEVATIYEGQGIAAEMTKKLLDFARENDYKVRPLCPYAKSYLERHTDFQDIIYDKNSQL
ncbi:MAG: GNAT family N-acetyltransferase [Dysgonomonas sp.]|nr:GNAT family N-acetyltransferase [Dysgonomonas sp.]